MIWLGLAVFIVMIFCMLIGLVYWTLPEYDAYAADQLVRVERERREMRRSGLVDCVSDNENITSADTAENSA